MIGGEKGKGEMGTRGARDFSFMCCLEDAFSKVVQEAQKEGRDYFTSALIHLTRGYYLSRSLALPFALSRAPSPLSWLLLFPLPTWFSLLRSSRANYIILLIRDSTRKVTSRAEVRVSSIRGLPQSGLLGKLRDPEGTEDRISLSASQPHT